jgi:hypothetical protein
MKEQIDKAEFLKSRGWFQWYDPNYWCHKQFDGEERDCTDWGLSLDDAYKFETDIKEKLKILNAIRTTETGRKILSELNYERAS